MRDIKDIYDDVLNICYENDINVSSAITGIRHNNYSGDSQLLSNDFLEQMFNLLMYLFEYAAKPTHTKPYASSKVVLFDTDWWGLTVAQSIEAGEYLQQGYYTAPNPKSWNIDENGDWLQSYTTTSRWTHAIYNNELIDTSGTIDTLSLAYDGQFNDRYEYSDFTEITSGALFDPSLVRMESYSEVETWFTAYDSVLSVFKTAIYVGDRMLSYGGYANYNCNMLVSSPLSPCSDYYGAHSSFSECYWWDEETGENGSVVQQRVILTRTGHGNSDSKTIYVYSEDVTFKMSDEQGGFWTIELPTSKDGVNFNDDLTTLHDLAVSKFPDTQSNTSGIRHDRDNITQFVLSVEYNGGHLYQNGSGYFEQDDQELNSRSFINDTGYSFVPYTTYTSKVYARWNGLDPQDEIDLGLTLLNSDTRDGHPFEYSISDLTGNVTMISKEVEGFYEVRFIRTIDKSPLIARTEIITLEPPL